MELLDSIVQLTMPRHSIDLDEAASTIAFEMFHLRYYAEVYESCPPPYRFRTEFGERIGQAYEYSFLLHLRVLLDFFYKKPEKDDVCVSHFPNREVAEEVRRCRPEGVERVSTNLNKRLAHFTEFRWKGEQKHLSLDDYRPYLGRPSGGHR